MALAKLRRWLHLLLALALAVGIVTHGVQAAGMSAKMAIMASTMPMPGGCSGCSGDDTPCASPGVCSLACANAVALVVASPGPDPVPVHSGEPAVVLRRAGWSAPPDPHPPRPSILT